MSDEVKPVPSAVADPVPSGAAAPGPTALLLMDIGTPADVADARPFLKRLYADPHVLQFSLSGMLLELLAWGIGMSRGARLVEALRAVGGRAPEKAELEELSRTLAASLTRALGRPFSGFVAFRHAKPGVVEALDQIRTAGCRRIAGLFARTFPSSAGSGSMRAELTLCASDVPELDVSMIDGFASDLGVRKAFATEAREALASLPEAERDGARLLFVLQGQPLREKRDPALPLARELAEAVRDAMGVKNAFGVAYQSEVDPRATLSPQAADEIARLGAEKCRALVLVPVSHVCETLATRWELDQLLVPKAKAAGIAHVVRMRAPAAGAPMQQALAELLQRHLAEMETFRVGA
jgi:protoporphyrin/coproporphyrin ferrochelatase